MPLAFKHVNSASKKNDNQEAHQLESSLTKYDGTFDDYLEMAIQFGYIYMFGWAVPLVALFSYVNNIVEVRSDMFKLTKTLQRPLQKDSANIGPWHDVLNFLSIAGIVTNMSYLLIVYCQDGTDQQSSFLGNLPMINRIGWIIAAEHFILAIKSLCSRLIPSVPQEIRDFKAREIYLRSHDHKSKLKSN
jgi:hypothetical protein